jgi:RNA polymerase sigma-70 factor (sigma-E family)
VQDCVASLARTAVSQNDPAKVVSENGMPFENDMPFEEFVAVASGRLFTMALLLTGRRRAEAEDLLQDVLERAYRRWGTIIRGGSPEPYVRQMLINAAIDWRRRLRRRREESLPIESGDSAIGDRAAETDDRDLVLRAMAGLPPMQRAVLVLRFYEDLTSAQTAAVLGCTVGAVKSQTSRALAKLRDITPNSTLGDTSLSHAKDAGHQKGAASHG